MFMLISSFYLPMSEARGVFPVCAATSRKNERELAGTGAQGYHRNRFPR